ncbi:hypothetical protein HUU05_03270 [candidate division KSB1 bacterium]|nr:hypothetical protein [candidate division KSB1 bacterium]
MSSLILTGPERSGSTLMCYLLNGLPDTVALHEPMKIRKFYRLGERAAICQEIVHYFAKTRKTLLTSGYAVSQHVEGLIPDNTFAGERTASGLRSSKDEKGYITIAKKLSTDFLLGIKHLGPFTALLEDLTARFPCYAVVRNPLAILASWNSVDLPMREGRNPAAERLDADLARALARITDRFDRQVHLLAWYFEKYARLLPESAVLRYENVIASQGRCLRVITASAETLQEPLANKNKNELYDRGLMATLSERLLQSEAAFWKFYKKEEVEALSLL